MRQIGRPVDGGTYQSPLRFAKPRLVVRPFNPRNPQLQSNTGQAKDDRARGNAMHINFSIRSLALRSLSLALVMLAMSAAALGQFRVSITIAPPALPVYEQPVCPGDGYIWTPGYWYWDDDAG